MKTELTADNLRDLVNLAAKIREDSFDIPPWDKDDGGEYCISIADACVQACKDENVDPGFAGIVECALHSNWNGTLDWSNK